MNKVFHIPVFDKWLVYAPFCSEVALTNGAAIGALVNNQRLPPQLTELKQCLQMDTLSTPELPDDKVMPSFLGIIPTRGCNIDCIYCNFAGQASPRTHMNPGIAVAAVNWMAKYLADHGKKQLQIHFFGGEPFIAPEVIDIVVHRSRMMAKKYGLELNLDASTNGVYNDTMCRFIGDYFDSIVLSLDGPARFHDKYRPALNGCATFERVDRTARIFRDMPVNLCIRVCITQDSVTHMEDITRWICETYSPAVINFESLTPGELSRKAGLLPPDPYLFAKHCFAAYSVASDMGINAVYSAADISLPRNTFCPVGTDALIVSHEGQINACYLLPEDWARRGMNLTAGQVHTDGSVTIDFDAIKNVRDLTRNKPRCKDCFCQWSCAGGCHVNQTYSDSSLTYTDFCIQTRLLTAAILLNTMDEHACSEKLLNDTTAMKNLAIRASDTLTFDSDALAC